MKEEVIDGIKYRLDEDNFTAEVTRKDEDYEGDIIIPEIVKFNHVSYRVTSIGYEAFVDCEKLTSITIPDSVTSIGDDAFFGCSSLKQQPTQEIEINKITYRFLMHNHLAMVVGRCYTEVLKAIDIPSEITYEGVIYRVTSIDAGVFACCDSLTSITIPDSVTSIGYEAFSGCNSLTSIVVAEGNTVYDSRENCNAIIEKNTNTLICGCQSTIIPDSVTCIGDEAFKYCDSLISITIPESVTSIGDRAFQSCCKLADLTISDGVTTIGLFAFQDCKALTSVTIPSSVKSIGEGGTFQGCTSLKLVQWNAINCIIETVDSKGNYYPPFANLSSIKNFTFGNDVKSIPVCLCCGLSGLTTITIPNGVTTIGSSAFKGCSSLKAIDIPDSVMIIENGSFYECKSLKIIALPSSVMIIEAGAFSGCGSLSAIRYDGTVAQCRRRCEHWGRMGPNFDYRTIHCTDGDTHIG